MHDTVSRMFMACVCHCKCQWIGPLQAWFCKRVIGGVPDVPVRHCQASLKFHAVHEFEGYTRCCRSAYTQQQRAGAAAVAQRIAAQQEKAADVDLSTASLPRRPLEHGRQEVVLNGMTAERQLQRVMGNALPEMLMLITRSNETTAENLRAAMDAIHESSLSLCLGHHVSEAMASVHRPPPPMQCVVCKKPTTPAGFAGRNICLLCYSAGGLGFSNVDMNYALVSGALRGAGMHSSWLQILLVSVYQPPFHMSANVLLYILPIYCCVFCQYNA